MNPRIKKIRRWNAARFYLSFLLLGFYLSIASVFLFTNYWENFLPKKRYHIGIILGLYGTLRFFIAYIRYNKKKKKINKEIAENVKVKTAGVQN
jgi:pilus assembly protein TadC